METKNVLAPDEPSVTRRDAGSRLITALGIGAIPIAMAAMSRKAEAQTAQNVTDALQFLLQLEYMQLDLHTRALTATNFVPAADLAVIRLIRLHESNHVDAMIALLGNTTPNPAPTFDWTAHGAIPGFNFGAGQYTTYLQIAQGIEDFGVRTYLGQAPKLTFSKPVQTSVLTIASVEGRHAAEVRRINGSKGWITGTTRDALPAIFQTVYNGEDNTVHDGVDSSAYASANGGVPAVTEAFDEPLTTAQSTSFMAQFM